MKQHIIEPLQDIEYVYFNNTKAAKEILDNQIQADGTWHELNVLNGTHIKIALRHTTEKDFKFERIDALILDAIGSLYDNGIYYLTTDMIARMIYQDVHHRIAVNMKQAIQDRIDVMMALKIRLNIEDECNERQSIPKDIRLQKKQYTYFLPMKQIDVIFSANSRRGKGYHLYQSPLIWEYAKYTKQIISFRFDAFSFLDKNITIEALMILRELYRRIEIMKNANNNVFNRKICLYRIENKVPKGLLINCGIDPDAYKNWNDKHRKLCGLIEAFLEYMKKTEDKQLRIKNYQHYETNEAEGYHINLYSRKYYKK
ncbi:MAG: hypothetical protein E7603_02930 [Ruminococcaceae bacterium]|nr:hypothetical protein [Oscillospiraceae bacterium]